MIPSAGAQGSPTSQPAGRQPLLGDVRTRVLVSFVVLLVVSTAASLLVLRQVLLSRVDSDVRENLVTQVESLRSLAESDSEASFDGDLNQIFRAFLERELPPDDGTLVAFVNGEPFGPSTSGQLDAELGDLARISAPQSGERSSPAGDLSYVAVPVAGAGANGVLVVAKLLAEDRARVESAIQIAAGVSIVVTLLASLFIWLAAGRAVAPLRALARTTRAITETDLSERVPVRGDGEIADLGRTFNEMLERLETAFVDQGEFLADVGHELRTPITVIRGNLETMGNDPTERREASTVIHDELERMSRIVNDLLLLARTDRPDFLRIEPLDLDLLTHELFAKARSLGVRRWLMDEVGVGLVHADTHRLTSAVMNLAQNAVHHTRGDEAIALGSSLSDDGCVRIWVRDEGEGIEADEAERLFDRFARGNGSTPTHGSGLGLAIVRAVTEAHGGHVELETTLGRGSCFTIVIPAGTHSLEPESGEPWPES